MLYHWLMQAKRMVFTPLLFALFLAIACGAAATATPAPTVTKAPAAAPTATKAPAAAASTATAIPVAKPTPTPPIPPRAKVERLKIAITPLNRETNIPWEGSGSDHGNKRPMMEHLIDVDQVTVQIKPMLATRWEMSPDGKTWTFQLRKGVPFHFGWGEFTGKDVVHSLERIISEGALASTTSDWRALIGKTPEEIRQNVKVIDNYQIVFNLNAPRLNVASFLVAAYSDLFMVSKAQWDKEGVDGMRKKPAGTGSYQFQEWKLGEYIRYERADNHWRRTPEFKELEMRYPREDATILAMLLSGEAHIVVLPRSLNKVAAAKGMKLIPSRVPISAIFYIMGGLYQSTPAKYDPKLPYTKRAVREALNRAIDRKEIQQTIFEGQGEPMYVQSFHPRLPAWNPEWENRFEERYGYDPEKAKKLIAQAGYPEGFSVKLISAAQSGLPEAPQLIEALFIYLKRIGLKVEIEETEVAKLRVLWREKNAHGLIWAHRGGYQPPELSIDQFNYSNNKIVHGYEDPRIDQRYETIVKSLNLAERERLLREIGDIKFEEYDFIPLFWLPTDAAVNPEVVGEYNFGTITGIFTHLEYVKPAR